MNRMKTEEIRRPGRTIQLEYKHLIINKYRDKYNTNKQMNGSNNNMNENKGKERTKGVTRI